VTITLKPRRTWAGTSPVHVLHRMLADAFRRPTSPVRRRTPRIPAPNTLKARHDEARA